MYLDTRRGVLEARVVVFGKDASGRKVRMDLLECGVEEDMFRSDLKQAWYSDFRLRTTFVSQESDMRVTKEVELLSGGGEVLVKSSSRVKCSRTSGLFFLCWRGAGCWVHASGRTNFSVVGKTPAIIGRAFDH